MVARYFAYGSNMNPARVRERGIRFHRATGAWIDGYALAFDKVSRRHDRLGHANLVVAPGERVEGVLYWLEGAGEIEKMDRFESAPVNYSREIVQVRVRGPVPTEASTAALEPESFESRGVVTWTYFANPAVRRHGLLPPRSYLEHLLAGRPYLSTEYYARLSRWPCEETI